MKASFFEKENAEVHPVCQGKTHFLRKCCTAKVIGVFISQKREEN